MTRPITLNAIVAVTILTLMPSSGVLAQTGDDDDSASSSVGQSSEDIPATADDDDSAGPTAPAPPKSPAARKESTKEICDDDIDNDDDGLIDCEDLNDCAAFRTCGQIQGGWGWVVAAYGLSFAALLGYALMVTLRLRRRSRQGGS